MDDFLSQSRLVDQTGWDIDSDALMAALRQHPEVAALSQWTNETQRVGGGMFERDRYATPVRLIDEFNVAADAARNDDVVSGVLESTESLAFARVSIEAEDDDEDNIWNQIAADINLDARLREMWRELFVYSQVYVATWWGTKSYKVKGKSGSGVQRKKTFNNLKVPLGLTILDPRKVVPVGSFMFNQENLAYCASRGEGDDIQKAIDTRQGGDPLIEQLLVAEYKPTNRDRHMLSEAGFQAERLFLMNPTNVFRHTATRAAYQPFAEVRMKSVFELLDLKNQLKQMDRAHLIGGTNFIILVKKGSDQLPAKPEEIANLQSMVRVVARVPVIVGDHRLSVEIVTPKTDNTLSPERYNGLDSRITARLYQMFMTGNYSAGAKGDDSIKLAKVVARGLESRRHMLRRTLEQNIIDPIFAKNDVLTSEAEIRFHPKHVSLDFDPALATYLLDLRDRGDISRETILEEIDFEELSEWRKRVREAELFDKDFAPTNVPFSAPGADGTTKPVVDPKAAGRTGGGNRNGGGAAPGSGQGQAPKRPGKAGT